MQFRLCYPIELSLNILRKKCGNKAKIEASVAEAFRVEEVSNFTTTYYSENLPPNMHKSLPRYNDDESSSTLSLFKGQFRRGSTGTPKILQDHEWRTIILCILLNLEEVTPYRE